MFIFIGSVNFYDFEWILLSENSKKKKLSVINVFKNISLLFLLKNIKMVFW